MQSGAGRRRGGPGDRRGRSALSAVLVVATALTFLVASAGWWADRTLLDTDHWVDTVGPLAGDPDVQAALTDVLTDQIMAVVQPDDLLRERLPAASHPLVPGMVRELRSSLEAQVAAVIASPAFADIWEDANRSAHATAVRVVRGEPGVLLVPGEREGVVALNLLPVVNEALRRFAAETPLLDPQIVSLATGFEDPEAARAALEERLGVRIEERFGSIAVFDDDRLVLAQRAVALVDRGFEVAVALTVVLAVAALVVSPARRRTAVQLLVGGAVVTASLGLAGVAVARGVTGLVGRADRRAAVEAVVDAFLEPFLATVTVQFLVLALAAGLLVLVGLLTGRNS